MTTSSIEHKMALVTGAGAGIGAEVARRLADAGARLLLVDKDTAALNALRRQIGDHRALCLPIDVTDIAAISDAIQGLSDAQRPDILVNAVGGDANSIPLADLDETYLETSVRHNLTTAFTMTRLCAPAMRRRRWGRIVNFASIAGRTYSYFSNAAYVAAKAAVIGLTKQTAYELAADGVCVNAVAHGPIATDRIQAAWAKHSPERRRNITERIPIGRLGTVDEAAAIVIHLCSQEAGYTTGTVIDINGGLFI
ncbi:SDR family oxidoreductase [Bradyrhizobium ontarionense]|uniref:SDR family oxidoreductase n=1 Tax=Bradyrhizobium ontarionense TaxID=2898149 RepID=A0ABY3RGZ2_9BRAD|nr:SDR family oxidoreductase [Bradyrhizobium sp. A19]UFZ06725.1 SDR family oxidoreductase [Bradyrhizobium sp. A19]